jgi:hypothetical protein
MSLDRMSRRSLLGGGTLLTIEKAIGAASAPISCAPASTKAELRTSRIRS